MINGNKYNIYQIVTVNPPNLYMGKSYKYFENLTNGYEKKRAEKG